MDADQDNDFGGTVITMNRPKMSIREMLATPTTQQAAPQFSPDEGEAEPPPATVQPEQDDPLPLAAGSVQGP